MLDLVTLSVGSAVDITGPPRVFGGGHFFFFFFFPLFFPFGGWLFYSSSTILLLSYLISLRYVMLVCIWRSFVLL